MFDAIRKILLEPVYFTVIMKRMAVLASGNGTNLQAIIDAVAAGKILGEVGLVISDRKSAYALVRAEQSGIPRIAMPRTRENRESYFTGIKDAIESAGCDFIVLAGFMKILPDDFVEHFRNRIINIHPALLPSFGGRGYYGRHVHEAVLESGARITGCTVHFVSSEVDGGPIIEQISMPVMDNDTPDTLAERIHGIEHEALVFAASLLMSGNYRIEGRRVIRL